MKKLKKINSEVAKAIELVKKSYKGAFHTPVPQGSDNLTAVKIGAYTARKFESPSGKVTKAIEKAMQSPEWPKNVNYKNGVLYLETATSEEKTEPEAPEGKKELKKEQLEEATTSEEKTEPEAPEGKKGKKTNTKEKEE